MVRRQLLLLGAGILLIGTLAHVDRIFFKRNGSFSIRFLYSNLSPNPKWDLPKPTPEEDQRVSEALRQKFYYLAKGTHCYAFQSEDNQYVIKFHRYPSHMRIFSWINHPLSYRFSERRKKIKAHNFKRLDVNLTSYRDSDQFLKDETGVIFTHINRTDHLRKKVTLVDKTKAEYQISLDDVTFILQKKADLIYPTLDRLYSQRKLDEAKQVITHIILLITSCCQKGFIDEDPVLKRNYGLLEDRAIHIDVGDLIKNEKIRLPENYIPHVKEMTGDLRKQLEDLYPDLLEHYNETVNSL